MRQSLSFEAVSGSLASGPVHCFYILLFLYRQVQHLIYVIFNLFKKRRSTTTHGWNLISVNILGQKNHLSGLRKSYLKLSFDSVQQLMNVKSDLLHVVERNQSKSDAAEAYELIFTEKRYVFSLLLMFFLPNKKTATTCSKVIALVFILSEGFDSESKGPKII